MKNLIISSLLSLLLPQLSWLPWHNKYLSIVATNSKAEVTPIHTFKNYISKLRTTINISSKTNLLAQNQNRIVGRQKIVGTVTNIKSNTDKMISYRHQRHMWVTSDDGIHVLCNQGTSFDNASLVLYSSFDGGKSWNLVLSLPNTNRESTADGFLVKQKLFLAYSSSNGSILFSSILYDSLAKKWTFSQPSVVYEGKDLVAKNTSPTIAFDSNGYLWTAFVLKQPYTNDYSIRLFNSINRGLNWNNTSIILGSVDKLDRKSARLVSLNNRLGVVYTHEDIFYWAYRDNESAFNTPWKTQSIFTYQPGSNNSMHSSHFSLVADPSDNIHLATHDADKLIYLKFDSKKQRWQPKKILSNDVEVGYMQLTLSTQNHLFITYNQQTEVGLLESHDYGKSFKFIKLLSHPSPRSFGGNLVNFEEPRIITPELIANKLPVLQQFQLNGGFGLVSFDLKLDAQSSLVPGN